MSYVWHITCLYCCTKYCRNGIWFSMECSFTKLLLLFIIYPSASCSIKSHISELLETTPNGVFQPEKGEREMMFDVFDACSVPIKTIVLFDNGLLSSEKNLWFKFKSCMTENI